MLQSDEVYSECESIARGIAASADGNFEVVRRHSTQRTWATIGTNDKDTISKQHKNTPNIYDKVWSGGKG